MRSSSTQRRSSSSPWGPRAAGCRRRRSALESYRTRRGDLTGHRRGRQLAQHSGKPPMREGIFRSCRLRSGAGAPRLDRARAEDRAAFTIEIAGHDVQRVEQERHQRAVPTKTRPGPPVDRCAAAPARSGAGRPGRRGIPVSASVDRRVIRGPAPERRSPGLPRRLGVLEVLGEDHLEQSRAAARRRRRDDSARVQLRRRLLSLGSMVMTRPPRAMIVCSDPLSAAR